MAHGTEVMFFKSASTRKEGWKAIATSTLAGESSLAARRDWTVSSRVDERARKMGTYVSTTPAETDGYDLSAAISAQIRDRGNRIESHVDGSALTSWINFSMIGLETRHRVSK